MKLFKLLKSCTVGFLALALIVGVMGVTKVSAADATVTFKASFGGKTYTYQLPAFTGETTNVSASDILNGLKAGENNAKDVAKLFSIDTLTATNGAYTIPKPDANKEYTVNLTPKDITTVFKAVVEEKTFFYKVDLENGEKNVVKFDDIAAGLCVYNESGTKGANIANALFEVVVTNSNLGIVTEGGIVVDYSTLKSAIEAETASKAENAVEAERAYSLEFDPVSDVIYVEGGDGLGSIWIASIKADNAPKLALKSYKEIKLVNGYAQIPLNDKNAGLKIAENKALYLNVTRFKPNTDKNKNENSDKITFTVQPTVWKSISAVIPNYAKAYPGIADIAISEFSIKDNENNVKSYVNGAANNALELSKLLYSTDNKNWNYVSSTFVALSISDSNVSGAAITKEGKKTSLPSGLKIGANEFVFDGEKWSEGFPTSSVDFSKAEAPAKDDKIVITVEELGLTGNHLYNLCNLPKTDKSKLYFKYEGSEGTEEAPATDPVRSSKVKNYSIPRVKELKSVKIDFVKATVAIKHGFDYYVASEKLADKAMPVALNLWKTILPYKKNDGKAPEAIVTTDKYVPQAKFDAEKNAASYTPVQVKSLTLADICADAWGTTSGEAFIYARKSATTKAPASAYVLAAGGTKAGAVDKVVKPAEAPVIKQVDGKYATAPATGKAFTIPTISKAESDTVARTFEYTIVTKADWDSKNVTVTNLKWSKFEANKTIKFTTKFSYIPNSATDKTKTDAVILKDDTFTECYILVRSAAVKEKALASEILVTKVTQDGTNLVWQPVVVPAE